jgi:hypothetical protein
VTFAPLCAFDESLHLPTSHQSLDVGSNAKHLTFVYSSPTFLHGLGQQLPFTLASRFSPFRSFESPLPRPPRVIGKNFHKDIPRAMPTKRVSQCRGRSPNHRRVTKIKTPVEAVAGHWMPG